MQKEFTKMHGAGNDYIYLNCLEKELENYAELAVRLSDRHKGIGGDGIVAICKSEVATAKMRMFNADGSEGKMCGNAIRCVGKYLYDNGFVQDNTITIETLSGVKTLKLFCNAENKVQSVQVNMGKADFLPSNIPIMVDANQVINYPLAVGNNVYTITTLSMGNPHCVVFLDRQEEIQQNKREKIVVKSNRQNNFIENSTENLKENGEKNRFVKENDIKKVECGAIQSKTYSKKEIANQMAKLQNFAVEEVGRMFENHRLFPERINTEFVVQIGQNKFAMRVWERGSGETLACGSGACAVAVAAVANGLAQRDREIEIVLNGGNLKILIESKRDTVYMIGDAVTVYKGEIEL